MDNQQATRPIMLGPRIPIAEPLGRMESILNIAVPNRVVEPRQASTTTSSTATATKSCGANDNTGLCEKPVSSTTLTLPIILGVVIPVVGCLVLFVFLQRRHIRKQREEDANDRHADMDFGLGNVPQPGRPKRAPGNLDYGEKGGKQRQFSMDLAMNSPYLLPPELQQSRESLHSLSRNINPHEDPYHPVTQYYPADGTSSRSHSRLGNEASSIYTGSSKAPSRMQELNSSSDLLSNAGGMSKSNPPAAAFVPPPRQNSLPQKSSSSSSIEITSEAQLPPPPPPYPVEPQQAHIQDSNIARLGLPSNPRPGQSLIPTSISDDRESFHSNVDPGFRASNNYLGAFINGRDSSPSPPPAAPPASDVPAPITIPAPRLSPPVGKALPASPRPPHKESVPSVDEAPKTSMDDGSDYGNGFHITPPSPPQTKSEIIRSQRYSMDVPPEEFAQAGLGAPGFDPRRLSMGFRPLPPPEATDETEDPEVRANRIRSFYKEYFDESKPAPAGQYYEDYDQNYLGGDAAYYDPNADGFVMPYAQPVTRRAMTPPPRGPPRFQGQGPPRGRQGSVGAMSMGGMSQGGRREPQMYPPGPYPQGPKAYSSASGASGRTGSRRPMPPPAALNTLPTPSKLRDDSFALLGAMEFAPPPSYRDRVAGRSESPLGERRAYSPAVPSFVPTASAFDELAPMPSPHLLRRSGTFTSLDFAPPKKFRDPDTMSDAGSIRSNRSGVSQRTQGAIRNGAYRVSRLPQDMVPTKDDMTNQLKPQWGMRVGS